MIYVIQLSQTNQLKSFPTAGRCNDSSHARLKTRSSLNMISSISHMCFDGLWLSLFVCNVWFYDGDKCCKCLDTKYCSCLLHDIMMYSIASGSNSTFHLEDIKSKKVKENPDTTAWLEYLPNATVCFPAVIGGVVLFKRSSQRYMVGFVSHL